MVGRVLVALSGTEYALVAIETAVTLAKAHGAELTGVTVVNTERLRRIGPVPMGAGDIAQQLRDERVAQSREAAEMVIERFEAACAESVAGSSCTSSGNTRWATSRSTRAVLHARLINSA